MTFDDLKKQVIQVLVKAEGPLFFRDIAARLPAWTGRGRNQLSPALQELQREGCAMCESHKWRIRQ